MIELISQDRCVACDLCVDICPTDVFDRVKNAAPVISRQAVCQTCFMCEVHCPVDAMYVSPLRHPAPAASPHRDEEHLIAGRVLGSYRIRLGWGKGRRPPRTLEEAIDLARLPAATDAWQTP